MWVWRLYVDLSIYLITYSCVFVFVYLLVLLFSYRFTYAFLYRWICSDYIGVHLGMYWDYIGCRGEVSFRTWSGVMV